jgi:hypothetical protein
MVTIDWILHLLALGCFVAAAFGVTSRVNLVAAGLALWSLALLIP